jgi:hypothetical protein
VSARLAEAQRALAEEVAKGAHERDMLHWKLTTSQTQCGVLEGKVLAVTQRVEVLSAERDALQQQLEVNPKPNQSGPLEPLETFACELGTMSQWRVR